MKLKHQLIAAGAAFDPDGERLFPKTTSGMGRAKCSCGWMSEPVEYGRQRKKLHAEHVEAKAPAEQLTTEELMDGFEDLLEGHTEPETIFETVENAVVPETPNRVAEVESAQDDAAIIPELDALFGLTPEPEPEPPLRADVEWPATVAKLFWKALAREGAQTIAEAWGLERHSNESKGELYLTGSDAETLQEAARRMTQIFAFAEAALKRWRKTSPAYKSHDLKTPKGRREAFAAEQHYLRMFCLAQANANHPKEKIEDGFEAGLNFKATEELL